MRNFKILTIDDTRWDDIIRSFNDYSPHYLNAYCRAFMLQGDGDPLLFYFDDGKTRAVNVVMKRDIALDQHFEGTLPINQYFDLATPYGYGGFLIDGEINSDLEKQYNELCLDSGYVCEFVRFSLVSNYLKVFSGEKQSYTKNVVRSLDLPLDEILLDFEHKVRKNIKKAANANLKFIVDEDAVHIEAFLDIYYGTMDRNNAKSNFMFGEDFFKCLNLMTGNVAYFHVLDGSKVISTELVLYDRINCFSFLGGTDSNYFHLRPNDFLKYEIIKWAKEKGLKNYILGGGYGADDGIFRYKKSFAPNGIMDFYTGRKIFDIDTYQKLVEMRLKETDFNSRSEYFPLYRG